MKCPKCGASMEFTPTGCYTGYEKCTSCGKTIHVDDS